MCYDAFISYRRENNGVYLAQAIHDQMQKRGITCFLDLEDLRSGRFDERLLEAVRASANFILILSKGALDRCINPDDWVRQEILAAVQAQKTIIPIMYDGFEWPRQENSMPEEIRQLQYHNGVAGTHDYLPAMIERIISYMSHIEDKLIPVQPVNSLPPITRTIHIAASTLTVVDSIMQGWDCENLFRQYGCDVEKHSYKWSDKILQDLASGKADLAIYNKESCLRFNRAHGAPITIVRDVCSSMGGRNFYILASRRGKWKEMTLEQFKQSLDQNTMIGVSKSSDLYQSLLYILDMDEQAFAERGIQVMDYHSDQGLGIFNFLPDLLVIAGQDIRFLAEQTGEFFEIISYDDFPSGKKEFFFRNSVNSLMLGPSGLEKLKDANIEQIGVELMTNFYRNAMTSDSLARIKKKLADKLGNFNYDEDSVDYIVKKIIFETYRIL